MNAIYVIVGILLLTVLTSVVKNLILNSIITFITVTYILYLCRYQSIHAISIAFGVTVLLMLFQSYNMAFETYETFEDSKNEEEEKEVEEREEQQYTIPKPVTLEDIDVDAEKTIDIAHYGKPENAENMSEKRQLIPDRGNTYEVKLDSKQVKPMRYDIAQRQTYELLNTVEKLQNSVESIGMMLEKSKPLIDFYKNLPKFN